MDRRGRRPCVRCLGGLLTISSHHAAHHIAGVPDKFLRPSALFFATSEAVFEVSSTTFLMASLALAGS